MGILIDRATRVVVQGITGAQSRFDTSHCLAYGTAIVAGVTPGRGGIAIDGVPVFNTVRAALEATGANASVIYVPARAVRDAVLEAVDAGIATILGTSENVPRHDAALAVAAVRGAGACLVGFNSNGLINPGARTKLGGIGGDRAGDVYVPGRIGVCSRSGGMSAEISWALKQGGFGVSTCVSLGGDAITGMRMVEVLRRFEQDPETDAMVLFGEPGTTHEQEVAVALADGTLTKPVVAVIVGRFQESYEAGVSFGHIAAMIGEGAVADTPTAKERVLREAGALIAPTLEDIPVLLRRALGRPTDC